MAAYDPRDDVPEADRAEQQREVIPRTDEDQGVPDEAGDSELADDVQVDPLQADEADQLEQARIVPEDDEYERP